MSLRRLEVYRALHQPILLAGAERNGALTAGVAAVGLIFFGATLLTAALGVVILLVAFPWLRHAAKADPKMLEVYRRSLRYQGYYAPRSTPWRAD